MKNAPEISMKVAKKMAREGGHLQSARQIINKPKSLINSTKNTIDDLANFSKKLGKVLLVADIAWSLGENILSGDESWLTDSLIDIGISVGLYFLPGGFLVSLGASILLSVFDDEIEEFAHFSKPEQVDTEAFNRELEKRLLEPETNFITTEIIADYTMDEIKFKYTHGLCGFLAAYRVVSHKAEPLITILVVSKQLLVYLVDACADRNIALDFLLVQSINNIFAEICLISVKFCDFHSCAKGFIQQWSKFFTVYIFAVVCICGSNDPLVGGHSKLCLVPIKLTCFGLASHSCILVNERA